MISMLTCNKTQFMYSLMTLFYYVYLYYTFSSAAATHVTMQRQKILPHTYADQHADLHLSGQDAFCNSHFSQQNLLYSLEVDNCLL